ncbi:hypothetical protein H7I53_03005 [Mycolicibacterium pulveris]|uniref:Uncharacterized protein n=1 Tax=Mycolicibacterium pulveris TaxID=36813 RepID=A0A7I7UF90_MYCPV|nr:hypothetical protein [Mycolicibacterium pulveris]MCV6979197.1 hypothetical protein [Mycolicibacterium pulveris]BBY79593.1 hypothetical protein MPUL_07510 [Mycolicibacterium pulveris]
MYFIVREEGAEIMASINAFTGVGRAAGVIGMSRTLPTAVTTAHPAIPAHAAAAAAAGNTPRKRRAAAAATASSVDWGPI